MAGMNAPFRLPRALTLTAVMFLLASGAHVLGGGVLPAPVIMAGLAVVMLLPVLLLTKARLALPVIVTVLALSQLTLHEAFSRLCSPAGFTPVAGGHLHLTQVHRPAVMAMGGSAEPAPLLMFFLHAVATLVTALVLTKGEEALWSLAAWLRPLVRLLTVPAVCPLPAPTPVRVLRVPGRWRTLRLLSLRGPPAVAAAA